MIQASSGYWLVVVENPDLLQAGPTQQQVDGKKNPEHDRDDSIHGEKRGIQFAQVVFGHQAVLIGQQKKNGRQTDPSNLAKAKVEYQRTQQNQHEHVEKARDPERMADAEIARNGMQPRLSVEFEILAGVEHVEAPHPESDRSGQKQDARIE